MAFYIESVTIAARHLRLAKALSRLQVSHVAPLTTASHLRDAHSEASSSSVPPSTSSSMYKFVVVGGGAGGLALASSLSRRYGKGQVAIIEPSDVRRYLHSVCLCLKLLKHISN